VKIAFLSAFYPYRGGIAQFSAAMYGELGKRCDVKAFGFKRQYPGLLFPGKTQYVTPEDRATVIESDRCLDTLCPLSWGRTARRIAAWEPDVLVLRYWMSWFAPSLGYVARRVRRRCRRKGHPVKIIAILDNVVPHEPHFFDAPLTRYFLKGCDGFVTMAGSVADDLKRVLRRDDAPQIFLQHPIYDHFGEKPSREAACAELGLDPTRRTLLFFGLIRTYKGLDILIEAFRGLGSEYQLLIAGEPYGSFDSYQAQIDSLPEKDRVHTVLRYIDDAEVGKFFAASDLAVLPYRSATQSGISAVACHFELPMLVTDVGGLKQTVGDCGTGLVVDHPTPTAVRAGIERCFEGDGALLRQMVTAIRAEKERLSWRNFCKEFTSFAEALNV